MDKTIIARTAAEMEEIGIELASHLRDGMVVSLVGPLGAGKTTLVKGLAKGLLIKEVVVSPSYLLAREYEGQLALHHLDAYRVSSLSELAEVGLDQLLPPEKGVSVIEWSDKVEGLTDASDVAVTIELREDGVRWVRITQR
jgi:tRNA threonylcarbamoyladenosine biosynthesis protein TsaE